MNLKFTNLVIEGFQSIGSAKLDLSGQGVVIVKGINSYENYANSNGSGKSSIFESICWAIYGKTSSGITDPANRYTSNGCLVKLSFLIDNQDYTIIRSIKHKIYKTGVKLFKGNEEISGRNKTDTEKLIKSDIIPINQDIFLSTVFLSQGFSNRLSALQPSGRKERIEVLTDTASQVESFRDKVMTLKNSYSDKYTSIQRDKSYKQGTADNIERQIESIIAEIEEVEKDKPEGNPDDISNKISKFESMLSEVSSINNDLVNEKMSMRSEISKLEAVISQSNRDIKNIEHDINDLLSGRPCPMCGRKDNTPVDQSVVESKNNSILLLRKDIEKNILKKGKLTERVREIDNSVEVLSNKESRLKRNISDLRVLLVEISKVRDTSSDKEKIRNLKSELLDIKEDIIMLSKSESVYETKKDVAHHCTSLISKQFRGYLLQGIIDFMNSRLEEYSRTLFSNEKDIINLVVDSSKLDIYLNDALYDTLSGGERRKVDLAIVLTQRDLALNIAGLSCNILILDETLENMDQDATDSTLKLLGDIASDVESMYIISHNNYVIPSDSTITVMKGKDRVAKVEIL